MKPCPIGESGACCRICSMGPCRLVGKDAEEKTGICGADMAHHRRPPLRAAGGRRRLRPLRPRSRHGDDAARRRPGEAAGYKVKDEQKLHVVAGYLGVPTSGREVNEIALDVADVALTQFGQPHGEIIYTKRATPKRQAQVARAGHHPSRHRPRGRRGDAPHAHGRRPGRRNILKQALRSSLADGWGGSMLSTDISDILFGTPSPLASRGQPRRAQGRRGQHHRPRPRADPVGDARRGRPRDPRSSPRPRQGAEGINLAGICCTANEILMRHGIPRRQLPAPGAGHRSPAPWR